MADEITTSLTQLQQVEKINADTLKQLQKTTSTVDALKNKSVSAARSVDKLISSVKAGARALRPFQKETTAVNLLLEKSSDVFDTATDKIVEFSMKGKTGAIGMQVEIKKLASNMMELAKQTQQTSQKLDDQVAAYQHLAKEVRETDLEIKRLNTSLAKGEGDMDANREALRRLEDRQKSNKSTLAKYQEGIEQTSSALREQTKATLDSHQQMVNGIKDLRAMDREARQLKGGLSGMTASLEEMFDSKLFQWLDKGAWLILLKQSLDMINSAVRKTGEMYRTNTDLARQYGREVKTGLGAFIDSGKEAQQTAEMLTVTAAQLGLSLEKLEDLSSKIRLDHRFGMFAEAGFGAEETVRNLTKEVAYFTQITGTETEVALDMLDRRMKVMGLSAQSAAADLGHMSIILKQMQQGIDNDTISMGEMVKMIEAASAASDSYIVDTRLLTTAMRAAANQAWALTQNQKLAKGVAESLGKVVSGSTGVDWVDTVSGLNLAKILKENPNRILSELTVAQKKIVKDIQEQLARGQINEWQAGRLLMENVGGTSAALESKIEQIMKVRSSPAVYSLIQEMGLAKNDSEAMMFLKTIDKAMANKRRITDALGRSAEIPMSELMADRVDTIDKALKGITDEGIVKSKLTREFGLTPKEAADYMKRRSDMSMGRDQQYATLTEYLASKLDPRLKAKDVAPQLMAMRASGRTQEEMVAWLKDQYAISKNDAETNKMVERVIRSGDEEMSQNLADLQGLQNDAVSEQEKVKDDLFRKLDGGFMGIWNAIMGQYPLLAKFTSGPGASLATGALGTVGALLLGVLGGGKVAGLAGRFLGGVGRLGAGTAAAGAAGGTAVAAGGMTAAQAAGVAGTTAAEATATAAGTASRFSGALGAAGRFLGPLGLAYGAYQSVTGIAESAKGLADTISFMKNTPLDKWDSEWRKKQASGAGRTDEDIKESLGSIATRLDEQRKDQLQGKSLPPGGVISTTPSMTPPAADAKTEARITRPRLSGQGQSVEQGGIMELDERTFDPSADTVQVKFKGMAALYSMMRKRIVDVSTGANPVV